MKLLLTTIYSLFTLIAFSQTKTYTDSLKEYQTNYVKTHEVVKGNDKSFISFFQVNKELCVNAAFTKVDNGTWFTMQASGKIKDIYRVYGTIQFKVHDTAIKLNLYQSQSLMNSPMYKNYLFLPFTDKTSGEESYGGGRYIDIESTDIKDNHVIIDFNKCYNPYCSYTAGYSCPIPPKENDMSIAVKAGEKNYGKKTH